MMCNLYTILCCVLLHCFDFLVRVEMSAMPMTTTQGSKVSFATVVSDDTPDAQVTHRSKSGLIKATLMAEAAHSLQNIMWPDLSYPTTCVMLHEV